MFGSLHLSGNSDMSIGIQKKKNVRFHLHLRITCQKVVTVAIALTVVLEKNAISQQEIWNSE